MTVDLPRRTLAATVELEGCGLHSGAAVRVRIEAGGRGVWFHAPGGSVEARVGSVTETTRCTALGPVSTVEHLLSALAGLGVTDAEVHLDGPELPGLDGSSLPYVRGIQAEGLEEIGRIEVRLFERVFLVEAPIRVAIAAGAGPWRYTYDSGDRWPGRQSWEGPVEPASYASEVAPARTFANEEEVEPLRSVGLGQGLDEESVLILGPQGYVNAPRFADEPARHKLLDLIGDLALSGVPPLALSVVAERSGHRSNVAAAARLSEHAQVFRT